MNGRSRQESLVPLPAMPGAGENLAAGGRDAEDPSGLVPIQMEGDGPLVVREKFHPSGPMTIDQALLQMELVGHDFYAYPRQPVRQVQRRLPPPWVRLRGHQAVEE